MSLPQRSGDRRRSEKETTRWVAFRIVIYVVVGHVFAAFLWLLFEVGKG